MDIDVVRKVMFDEYRPANLIAGLGELQRFPIPVYSRALTAKMLAWREFLEQWARVNGIVSLSLYRPVQQWAQAVEVCQATGAKLGIIHYCFARPMKRENNGEVVPVFGVGRQPPENLWRWGEQYTLELEYIRQQMERLEAVRGDVEIAGVYLDLEAFDPKWYGEGAAAATEVLEAKAAALYWQVADLASAAGPSRPTIWYYNYGQPEFRRVPSGARSMAGSCSLYEPCDFSAMLARLCDTLNATKDSPVYPCLSLGAGFVPLDFTPKGEDKRRWENDLSYGIGCSWRWGNQLRRVDRVQGLMLWPAPGGPQDYWPHYFALNLGWHGQRFSEGAPAEPEAPPPTTASNPLPAHRQYVCSACNLDFNATAMPSVCPACLARSEFLKEKAEVIS